MPVTVSPRPSRRGSLGVALFALLGLVIPAGVFAAKPPPPPAQTIQILNVSDWHGNVDPVGGIGGAWNISARWDADRAAYPTLSLTAGDDYNASPPLSSFFEEVPAVLAQRLMGIQVGTLGNHNFDRGIEHLQQMVDLAGAPTSADAPGDPFKYVAANLNNLNANVTGIEPVAYFNVGGFKVAVIGIVNEEASTLVLPGSMGTLQVTDSVEAANKWSAIARGKNKADAVVIVTHKGVRNLSGAATGELVDFANAVNPDNIDVIIGDHTDIQYSGTHNGILVHENRSYGQTYAKTLLTIQPRGGNAPGNVIDKSVQFVNPGPSGALSSANTSCGALTYCDQAIVDMLAPYRLDLAALLDGKIGTTTEPYKRGNNIERLQEMPIGNLVADGMRWRYATQLAMVNGGGIRQQLPTCSYSPADTSLHRSQWNVTAPAFTTITTCPGYASGGPYDIVLGDTFAVLNFANILNTRTVTGAQLWLAMEHSVRDIPGANGRFAQISGFKFGYRADIATGCSGNACTISRVQWMTLADGTPIPNNTTATYTIALTNFTNLGGDGYFMFNDGIGASQEIDWIVLAEYIKAFPTLDPTADPLGRITKCPGACSAP